MIHWILFLSGAGLLVLVVRLVKRFFAVDHDRIQKWMDGEERR